jgi:hypothetical protein
MGSAGLSRRRQAGEAASGGGAGRVAPGGTESDPWHSRTGSNVRDRRRAPACPPSRYPLAEGMVPRPIVSGQTVWPAGASRKGLRKPDHNGGIGARNRALAALANR